MAISAFSVEKLLELISTLKDSQGWIRIEDFNLIDFIKSQVPRKDRDLIVSMLMELTLMGYISLEKEMGGNKITGIKIIQEIWDESRVISYEPAYVLESNRRFAVFVDYLNLEKNIGDPISRFKDFSWLLDPILEQGIIEFAFVFIPENLSERPAIMQLAHIHNFSPILCPRLMKNFVAKDKDSVDIRMISLGKTIIEHSDVTDIVIVSGDADFQELVMFAIWHRKRVYIKAPTNAASRSYSKIRNSRLTVERIS